ncbi:hypothetical protein MBLNU230_g1894t1 [Neophaeotheca triangularis]
MATTSPKFTEELQQEEAFEKLDFLTTPWRISPSKTRSHTDISLSVLEALSARGLRIDARGQVQWRRNSNQHPRQWNLSRKLYDTTVICFIEFFVTMVSNTGTPIADEAAHYFGISRTVALACFMTTYLLGQAMGGLLFPPITESFGARTLYAVSTLIHAVCCLLVGTGPGLATVYIPRFVSGLMSGVPAIVAAGSLENIWDARARIWTIHIWVGGSVVGLAIAPAYATYITVALDWWWVFYISAAVTGVLAVLCVFLRESRPSQVLKSNVRAVIKETGYEDLPFQGETPPDLKTFVHTTLLLPLRLFFTEPLVFLSAIMAASVYAIIYLFTEALNTVYRGGFDMDRESASLVFLAFGVGTIFTFLPRVYDARHSFTGQAPKALTPEDKLAGFYIAAPVLMIGLWWFAWTVPPLITDISPWASIAALLLIGYSTVEFDNVLSGYLTDTYTSHAASANAPVGFLRAVLSGTFPLFGRQMFLGLGSNVAVSILAAMATLYVGFAVLFARKGRKLRLRSRFVIAQEERGEKSTGVA